MRSQADLLNREIATLEYRQAVASLWKSGSHDCQQLGHPVLQCQQTPQQPEDEGQGIGLLLFQDNRQRQALLSTKHCTPWPTIPLFGPTAAGFMSSESGFPEAIPLFKLGDVDTSQTLPKTMASHPESRQQDPWRASSARRADAKFTTQDLLDVDAILANDLQMTPSDIQRMLENSGVETAALDIMSFLDTRSDQ